MSVRVQLIKIYDVDVPDAVKDPIAFVHKMQSTEIEAEGKLIEVQVDFAEEME